MNMTDLEAVRQLIDMAQAVGLDLVAVQFGGPGGTSVQFSRPPASPTPVPLGVVQPDAQDSTGRVNVAARAPHPAYFNKSLWVNGEPPSFPTPGL